MKRQLLCMAALACLLAFVGQTPADQGERYDNTETVPASQLRGTWIAVSMEQGGRKENLPNGVEMKFTFDKGKLAVNEGGRATVGSYITNDARNPKEIDLIPPKDLKGAEVIKGIYRVDGDTLKLSFTRGGNRPKGFNPKVNESGVITFKRKK